MTLTEMEGSKYLIVLALLCGLANVCISVDIKSEKITTNLGGGECVDEEDCSSNGMCMPGSGNKGTCRCVVGFTGANCETTDANAKESLGTQASKAGATVKTTKKGGKRSRLQSDSDASKRTLDYDKESNLVGLSPESVAEVEQPVLLYNPLREKYLFVSKDYKATGKHNAYVEARGDRLGLRNTFLIKKVPNEQNKYFIFNVEQEAYMYMSNSKSGLFKYRNHNILASTGEPNAGGQVAKYIFEFEDENDDGFYKIKNQEKYLYVSDHLLGIPAYPLVKATNQKELARWQSQYFQIVLKEKAKNIRFSVTGDEVMDGEPQTLVDNTYSSKSCHDASKGDAEQTGSLQYTEAVKESRTYSKTQGFSVSGDTSGLTASVGKLTFTYKNDQTSTDVSESTKTIQKTANYKVPPNTCVCVAVTFQSLSYKRQYTLEATTKEGKTITATGAIYGNRFGQFDEFLKTIPNKKGAKCPHEM